MLTRCAAGGLLAIALVWSFLPIPLVEIQTPSLDLEPVTSNADQDADDFDESAFKAAIWVEPPAPSIEPPTKTPPPVHVRLTLIGIVQRTDPVTHERVRFAALYDPDEGRLYMARDGERIGSQLVESITDSEVVVSTNGRQTTLELVEDKS